MRHLFRRVFWPLAALALLASAGNASAKVRALFVGVDQYQFSNSGARFANLEGTVNDVGHIKAALQAVYGWALDAPAAGQCQSANAVSITLTDACATRAAILAALDQLIHASAAGDTVIFYYAGHGSQVVDSQHLDQPSGLNDTILPYDARDPGSAVPTEILDEELNVLIENANHIQGVNIVTILDSCHSATGARATRGEVIRYSQARGIRAMVIATRRPLPPLQTTGFSSIQGYRVHLAAAGDNEFANETILGGKGPPAGVFTTALVAAIKALPGASFADIMEEAQRGTEALGNGEQHPAAEGALDHGFVVGNGGGGGSAALLLAASRSAGGVRLAAGTLSGMTMGSAFALYGSWTDARDAKRPPLATGHIGGLDMASATLILDAPPPSPLQAQLVARETRHLFGNAKLLVRVTGGRNPGAELQQTIAAVNAMPFAQVGEPAEVVVHVDSLIGAGSIEVETAAGNGIAQLPAIADPAEPGLLQGKLAMIARVDALLALRTNPATAQLVTCVNNAFFPIAPTIQCPAPAAATSLMVPGQAMLAPYQPIHFAVANTAPAPRFVYVFRIDPDNTVALLTPQDAPLAPGRVQMITFATNAFGLERFLVIATDAQHPINAAALEQGQGARDVASCASVLEKLLCQAGNSAADPSSRRAGSWSAIITTATIGYSAR